MGDDDAWKRDDRTVDVARPGAVDAPLLCLKDGMSPSFTRLLLTLSAHLLSLPQLRASSVGRVSADDFCVGMSGNGVTLTLTLARSNADARLL